MTKRRACCTASIILATQATSIFAEQARPTPALTVCLTFSGALEIGSSLRTALLAQTARIWGPLGVTVGLHEDVAISCNRPILVKSDLEARPEDAASDAAIAWVPFVAGRARQLVFLRVSHARMLVDAFSPGMRPPGLTEQLLAKLLGRSLAHELGHVLLNTLGHERSGLMRPRYHPYDI
jgi:hypothetical protein